MDGIQKYRHSSICFLEHSQKEQSKIDIAKLEEIGKLMDVTPIQLMGFDEKQIFNQYNNETATVNGSYHNHFPDELKSQYEKRIAQLEGEVLFLRELSKK